MSTENDKKGKGYFVATPLEFTLDGTTYKYAGRGRWSSQLASVVLTDGKAPVKQTDGTWGWREANEVELAAAKKLVDKIAAKLKEKAEKAALKMAAKASKKAKSKSKSKSKKVKETGEVAADSDASLGVDVPVEENAKV